MPDTKITALAAITTVDPAADVLPIVDISDTSMAASGTTKKITSNQILGAGGTATLASATITGDLTVDTSTLKVDSANNRVGVGTASPTDTLDVNGRVTALRYLSSSSNAALPSFAVSAGNGAYNSGANEIGFSINSTSAMTLNSTGLGVGAVPSGNNQFTVRSSGAGTEMTVSLGRASAEGIIGIAAGTNGFVTGSVAGDMVVRSIGKLMLFNNTANAGITIDTAANVGIGVTPSAGKGCLQLSSGINFPATQVASSDANTLDDYEEGTFTPTIVGTTTAGTGTYSTQQGRYTKIGNQVTVHIYLDWSAHTGTGNLRLAGLPFQSSNNFHACSIGFWNNIAVTAANVPMAYVINQETNVALLQMPSGGGAMAGIPMDTAGSFVLTGTYTV